MDPSKDVGLLSKVTYLVQIICLYYQLGQRVPSVEKNTNTFFVNISASNLASLLTSTLLR